MLPGSERQKDTVPYPPQANENWVFNGVHLNRQRQFQSEKKKKKSENYQNIMQHFHA